MKWLTRLGFLLAMLALCISCSDSNDSENPTATKLVEISGNYQSGFHGDILAPLSVRAVDEAGKGVPGVTLDFRLLDGEGLSSALDVALSPSSVITGPDGNAEIDLQLGQQSGSALIEVRDSDRLLRPLLFRAFSYAPASDTRRPLCVLEINDWHSRVLPKRSVAGSLGGLARLATIFKEIRRMNDAKGIPTLIVNSGDDFENTMFHNVEGGISAFYRLFDAMGVDVLQLGNHDYHFGTPFLDAQVEGALPQFTGTLQGTPMRFIWGSVNPETIKSMYNDYIPKFETEFSNTTNDARYNQTLVLDMGGIKIGLLGVVTDAAIYTQVAGNPFLYQVIGAPTTYSQNMEFYNPDPRESDYVNQGIDSLDAEGADVVLVTSHAGLGFGDRVNIPPGKDEYIALYGQGATSGRSVDLILSAHSHVQLNHPISVTNPAGGTTYLAQAKEAGEFVAAMALEIDTEADAMTLLDYHLIQVDDRIAEDEEILEGVQELKDKVNAKYGHPFEHVVGSFPIDLSHRTGAQSGLGQIISDAFLWKLNEEGVACDVAMGVPSIYRADLVTGDITEDEIYDIVPLHQLDDEGVNDEPLVILEMQPGLYDYTLMENEESMKKQVTATEYVTELVYSMAMIDEILPGGLASDFKLDVIQLAGMDYKVDLTAPYFQRIESDSILVNGEPIDPDRTYRLAMVHSLGTNLSYIFNFIISATDPETGDKVRPVVVQTGDEPYIDTHMLAWEALRDYFEANIGIATTPPDNAVVTGERFRSTAPDLTVNVTDIAFGSEAPIRGESLEISASIRNLGEVAADRVQVDFYYESTPWDLTDDDDGRLEQEGFTEDFRGSLVKIGDATVTMASYPAVQDVHVVWDIPKDLVPYDYPIVVRIEALEIDTTDPHTDEPYTEIVLANNCGPDQQRRLHVVAQSK